MSSFAAQKSSSCPCLNFYAAHPRRSSKCETHFPGNFGHRCLATAESLTLYRVDTFFQTYHSFQLFRKPEFWDKVCRISSDAQLCALFASMNAWTVQHEKNEHSNGETVTTRRQLADSQLNNMAVASLELAMSALGDSSPPLCVVQALILATHWLLIQGVHGRAWRYLGLCIRLAYELNLHSVDTARPSDYYEASGSQWCEDEEKRRAWWAIRELDIFASAHRRLPMGTFGAPARVFLPADAEKWFAGEPQRSCLLLPGLTSRIKALMNAGKNSPQAWHMVLNSLLAEAFNISTLTSSDGEDWKGSSDQQNPQNDGSVEDSRQHQEECLKAVLSSLYFFKMVLPDELRYKGQYLSFGANQYCAEDALQTAQRHCWVFSIYLLVEVAMLVALKPFVLGPGAKKLAQMLNNLSDGGNSAHPQGPHQTTYSLSPSDDLDPHLERFFGASDNIFAIITNSHERYRHYVNPFLAQAPWMAAAVQLLQQTLSTRPSQREASSAKYEVLRMAHSQFVAHWNMSRVPQENLDAISAILKNLAGSTGRQTDGATTDTPLAPDEELNAPQTETNGPLADPGLQSSHLQARLQPATPSRSNHPMSDNSMSLEIPNAFGIAFPNGPLASWPDDQGAWRREEMNPLDASLPLGTANNPPDFHANLVGNANDDITAYLDSLFPGPSWT